MAVEERVERRPTPASDEWSNPRAGGRRHQIACISSAPSNPYLRLLYDQLALYGLELADDPKLSVRWLWRARRQVGFVHFHWPEVLHRYERGGKALRSILSWAKLATTFARVAAARALGYRLIWTIHQVQPHESDSPTRDEIVARLLGRACHVLLAHDRATADLATERLRLPQGRVHVVPHGSYVGVYPPGRPRAEVRAELGIALDAFVFLAFGELRRYKGIELLLQAFASARLDDAALVIAGSVKEDLVAATVRQASADDSRIRPLLGLVPDTAVAELFQACDVAVLARSDGGTSGSLVLALSLGLPVIAADLPPYRELSADGRAGWLFRPGDPASLRAALEAAADPADARERGSFALEIAQGLSWPEIGERTARLLLGD